MKFAGSVKDFPKEAMFGLSWMHEQKLAMHFRAQKTGSREGL